MQSLPALRSDVIGGRAIAWREAGSGTATPLLLLHGIGSNSRAWAGQFAGLADARRIIAWNAPGYGDSEPLPLEWPCAEDYAQSAADLLDHLGVARCVLVGQSLGAIMAAALAGRQPHRVAGLVLASPATGYASPAREPLPKSVQQRVAELQELGPEAFAARRAAGLLTTTANPETLAMVRLAMSDVRLAGYLQAARLLAVSSLPALVAGLAMPRLVMWGGADRITSPESCRAIAVAAQCAAVEVPGFGHAFASEAPELFNAELRRFIAQVEPRSPAWT